MLKIKSSFLFVLFTIFLLSFSACSSLDENMQQDNSTPQKGDNATKPVDNSTKPGDNSTKPNENNGGGALNPDGEIKPDVTPINLTGNPFSLLGVYDVELYGIDADAKEVPVSKSELRVGLNLTSSKSGMPEVLMMLLLNDKFIMFDKHNIDLSTMGSTSIDKFIAKTFADLGAELVTGSNYNLIFTLNPSNNPQYSPLLNKNIIKQGQYLKVKLNKVKDLSLDKGLEFDMSDIPVERISFDREDYKITKKESFQLNVSFYPFGTSSKLTWSSNKPHIAEVSDNGTVTIKSNDDVEITAVTENGKTATFKLIPSFVHENFELNTYNITLYIDKNNQNPQAHKLEVSGVPQILLDVMNGIKYYTNKGDSIVSVNSDGLITAKGIGEDTVNVRIGPEIKKCYVEVKYYPEGITFEHQQYRMKKDEKLLLKTFIQGTTKPLSNVRYTATPADIINIDSDGNVTTLKSGDVKVDAEYQENGKTFNAETEIVIYTPIDIAKPETLQGTYEIVDFKSDSYAPFGIKVYVGTTSEFQYRGTVQRMIGKMSLSYNGSVNMTTQLQMESSRLEAGTMGVNTSGEQLALTQYAPIPYAGGKQSFGSKGALNRGEVTQEGDLLKISQYFKKSGADVYVSTFVRKISDTVPNLNTNRLFDYMDAGKSKQSNARRHNLGSGGPLEEPPYTLGLINYQ